MTVTTLKWSQKTRKQKSVRLTNFTEIYSLTNEKKKMTLTI